MSVTRRNEFLQVRNAEMLCYHEIVYSKVWEEVKRVAIKGTPTTASALRKKEIGYDRFLGKPSETLNQR